MTARSAGSCQPKPAQERQLSRVERRLRGGRASSRGKRAVAWAVGDGADGGSEAKALAARIVSEPRHFLYLGDVYDNRTAEEFERNYRSVYGGLRSDSRATPGTTRPRRGTRRAKGRSMHYSFRAGAWELVSLNSEALHDEDSAQVRWLRREGGREQLSHCLLAPRALQRRKARPARTISSRCAIPCVARRRSP
jgi:hypothetical protein